MRYILLIFLFLPTLLFPLSSLTYLNRILKYTEMRSDKNIKRLSSGRELLPDNPAYYAIYEKLEAYIRGIGKIVGNESDMYQYYRFEESVLASLTSSLQRNRDLSLQLSGGILGDFEKGIIKDEMDQNYDQILYELKSARFNKIYLFKDLFTDTNIIKRFKAPEFYNTARIDALLNYFIKRRALLGALMNRLKYQINGKEVEKQNTAEFQSHGDTDIGAEMADFRRNNLLMLVNIMMMKK